MTKPARWKAERAQAKGDIDNHLDICSDPAFATHSEDSLAEPVIAASFWKNRKHDAIRVTLSRFEGFEVVDIREHYSASDGRLLPTKKGLTLRVLRLPDLARAVNAALKKATELGLLKDEGGK